MPPRPLNLLFFILILFCACERKGTTHYTGNVMTIDYKIIVGKRLDAAEEENVRKIVLESFQEVNNIYNKWNPYSELSQLNRLNAQVKQEISPQLEKLLRITDNIVKTTEGRFDPTIEPLQRLWKEALSLGQVPSPASISEALSSTGWKQIHIENGIFWKENDKTELDLGGIAKGYAVDLIAERIHAAGFPDLYVEWGGEIRAFGQHPENRPWNIFISRLDDTDPSHAIAMISLHNEAIATSGDYLQSWQVHKDGKIITYFHIIDPRTGYPMEAHEGSIASASVLAPTCAWADGIATAFMLFDNENDARAWAESLKSEKPAFQFWLLSRPTPTGKAL